MVWWLHLTAGNITTLCIGVVSSNVDELLLQGGKLVLLILHMCFKLFIL